MVKTGITEPKEMAYSQALQAIEELARFGINPGLSRITKLMEKLGNPQDSLAFIHIAGTNGKGSTASMLAAVLKEAGYRVGLFTSPHLHSYTERFMIDGKPIEEREFAFLTGEILPLLQQVRNETGDVPTEFEMLTALAFLYFSRKKTDIVVLEAGLGGDIDSTNVIKGPLLSIITNVNIEHTEYLGQKKEEIASRKSGIIKKGRPALTAENDERVLAVLREKAASLGAPLYEVGKEVHWEQTEERKAGQSVILRTPKHDYGRLALSLRGQHQVINAALAVRSLEVLSDLGWRIDACHIARGLANAVWPGRIEILREQPLVVIDGAHNPAGMEMLSLWLTRKKSEIGRIFLVIGMLADKDRAKAAHYLDPLTDKVIITRPFSERAGKWEELAACFRKDQEDIIVIEDLSQALRLALGLAGANDMVLVTGSLYLIGEARRLLLQNFRF